MFHTSLPQFLGGAVVGQLEADCGFELLELAGTQFHVEVVSLVTYFQYFGPRETVDAESENLYVKSKKTKTYFSLLFPFILNLLIYNS